MISIRAYSQLSGDHLDLLFTNSEPWSSKYFYCTIAISVTGSEKENAAAGGSLIESPWPQESTVTIHNRALGVFVKPFVVGIAMPSRQKDETGKQM